MKRAFVLGAAAAAAIVSSRPLPAEACGGCFAPPNERTVVTDHRMALAVSTQQTVLWDQIRYSGDPAEFAWVLPVRAGARLELSTDEWFAALDASTQPVVVPPDVYGGAYGCGLTGCAADESSAASASPGPGEVQVLAQSVVGPYETVTLRATDDRALRAWLDDHSYAIPAAVEPVIDAYVHEGFDFIALRLRPDCGQRSMLPVRVVTQGADPTLPLRMVAAGVGAKVGLTLFVISEGRYAPQNFPVADVSDDAITWDRTSNRSTYDEHTTSLMAREGGRTWVVEYADEPQLFTQYDPRYPYRLPPSYVTTGHATTLTPGLADAYFSQCTASPWRPSLAQPSSTTSGSGAAPSFTPCPEADAGAAPVVQEQVDAEAPVREGFCHSMDDLDVALAGLHPRDVWLTRLRASLPANALSAGDLRLQPAASQTVLSNVHYTQNFTDEVQDGDASCISAPKRHSAFGTWALAAAGAIAAIAYARRRERRR